MRGKQLRRAVLLGMAMSMVVWTTGMAAETIDGNITGTGYENKVVSGDLTVNGYIYANRNGQTFHISTEKTDAEAGNITINSSSHGIETNKNINRDLVFDVELNAAGSNIIHFNNGKGDGIFTTKVSENYTDDQRGSIQLNAAEGNIIIGEGQNSSSKGNGDGIYTGTNNVAISLNGKYNYISAGKNAVHSTASGDIIIQAVKPESEGDISTFADYVDYTNVLVGGTNGIWTEADGNTNVIADADNIIAGATNGILSNGTSEIIVTAGNNNYIGQYIDENEQTVTSQTAINASSGTVSVTAGKENVITATTNGVASDGAGTLVSLSGASNTINVNNDAGAQVIGVDATGNGTVDISSSNGGFVVNLETTGVRAYGISAGRTTGGGGTISINTTGDIGVDITTGAPDATGGNVDGVVAKNAGVITLNSGSNVIISTHSQVVEKPSNEGNDVSGIRAEGNGSVQVTADGFISISNTDENAAIYGIHGGKEGSVTVTAKGQNEYGYGVDIYAAGKMNQGVFAQNGSSIITAENGGIRVMTDGIESTNAVHTTASELDSSVTLDGQGDIYFSAHNDGIYLPNLTVSGLYTNAYSGLSAETAVTGKDIAIEARSDNNATYGIYGYALGEGTSNHVAVSGNNIQITAEGGASQSNYGVLATNSKVDITAQGSTTVSSNGYGLYAWDSTGIAFQLNVNSAGNNAIYGGKMGVVANGALADLQMTSNSGNNSVQSDTGTGVRAFSQGNVNLQADGLNYVNANTGIWTDTKGSVVLNATDNQLTVDAYGAYADTSSEVELTAIGNNIISAGVITESEDAADFGNSYGVYAVSGSTVSLEAGNQNTLYGALYANGTTTDEALTSVNLNGNSNVVQSAAVISNAGNLDSDADFAGKEVISSLYAEDGAQISVSGNQNVIRTYADNTNENQLERTVWAYNTADISIDGQSYISTDRYETSPNSLDIAIAAGTATGLTEDVVLAPVADRATVTLNYDSYTDAAGNVVNSVITGDILSAYAGQVDITPKNDGARIDITGNLLAGNNGVLNVNLGNGGTLTGRADDYGDAGVINGSSHTTFFDPAFSSEIFKGGEVNLTMGDNSRWNVTGQSWITRINTEGSSNAIIDLVSANTDRNASAHALTIYEMNGDAVFNMSLDADRTLSDMVYMKNANGEYVVNVVDPVTQEDMYAGRSDGGIFDGLRFATVGKGSTASFRAITWDQGINNIEYEVGTDSYDTSDENHHYDSSTGNGSGDTEKPGSDLVEGFFDSEGTPGTPEANGVMMLAAQPQDSIGTDTGANGTTVDETTNYKLIGVKSTELSDAGKTVVSMSRINYSNAVYMDRLNKRMGEARYLDGDEGLWVRMRHDRIGKSDAFRSMNTMMELGYDRKVGDREDGEHRQGFALDYMRGTADYKNVAGEGDVRRAGVWFYDTWLGDKGHYTDYVLKFGRLSNDFEVYARSTGEKITGDYSNFVYSASAEYGRKKDLGNDWYIEPQAQIQYAHVTDADYTTSQGTNVQLDAIDSLIGRVGFRLGKDMGEKTTFYVKADILHEFLGDQDIEARDATGYLDTTYENEGTWYDVGLGFSHQFSKGTYMFLDMEKTFGNDNEDTYQFNVGMNWKV